MSEYEPLKLSFDQEIRADSGSWYNNLQWLGQGGNAATFLMVASSGKLMGNQFAVKIFQNIPKPERRDSFLEEIRFLRDHEHPSILRIFDEGTYQDNHPFVVAEYLPTTLREVIRSRRSSMAERLSYTIQLLSALAYLNSLDPPVIHRDIKPENIFLNGASCVLGDFGLLKRLGQQAEEDFEERLRESVGPGMPFFYRTPDLVDYALGKELPTTKTDLFQVGLVLAEMFSGRNPQRRADHGKHLAPVELETIGFIPGFTHVEIRDLLKDMLEMKPENRPSIEECLTMWQGIFRSVAKQVNAIEGTVF